MNRAAASHVLDRVLVLEMVPRHRSGGDCRGELDRTRGQ